ncbi:hypothetical protein NECID01_0160 [Nematocida sp. AWRm77]|nr:hypothetical protein NECID01_0160 [Nematocida sp. AWRm77]
MSAAITLNDLISENEHLVEKEALGLSKKTKAIPREKQESPQESVFQEVNPILDVSVETELELALARVRYTQEEIEAAKEKRKERVELSLQAAKNAYVRRIKSKAYRRHRRQDKQKEFALAAQIEAEAEEDEDSSTSTAEEESSPKAPAPVHPEAESMHSQAHSLLAQALGLPDASKAPEKASISVSAKYSGDKQAEAHTSAERTPMEAILDIEFAQEKEKHAEQDKPTEEEVVVPGWNAWGGASIEPKKNFANTKKIVRSGVDIRKRKDYKVSHVIYNERASQTRNPKYGMSKVPSHYKDAEEYKDVLAFSLSAQSQPATILSKLVREEKQRFQR